MKQLTITVRGRELAMHFDTETWLEIEEEFGSLEAMYDLIDGQDKPMANIMRMTAIIINAGEKKTGRTPDITPEWLRDNMSPKQMRTANTLAKTAIMIGWKRETVDEEDDGPVDVELESIQKKTENESQPESA